MTASSLPSLAATPAELYAAVLTALDVAWFLALAVAVAIFAVYFLKGPIFRPRAAATEEEAEPRQERAAETPEDGTP